MGIPLVPPVDYRPLFDLEHRRIIELLRSLTPQDWQRPTPCPGWTVHGLAAHLIGGSLSVISWLRDGFRGTSPAPGVDEAGFIGWLDDLQMEWVEAARRISPRLTIELLDWTHTGFTEAITAQDPQALTADVSWAAKDPVPVWLDHARELTEKWIHRQQILEALGRPSDLRSDLADPVLDALRWAYPFRLGDVERPPGSAIEIAVVGDNRSQTWHLVTDGVAWHFDEGEEGEPLARVVLSVEQAWRLLTNNYTLAAHGPIGVEGDQALIDVLLRTRAIIGTPRSPE